MRIGVLGNEGSWYVNQLCSTIRQRGHDAFELQFPRLKAVVRGGAVVHAIGDLELSQLDALIVRTMPPGSLEQVVSRMDFLAGVQDGGCCVINSPRAIECAVDKYLTTQKLAQAGLPVPDTIVCEDRDAALEAFHSLGGDVVVKPLFGAEGRGIIRVNHPEMALRVFRTLERLNAIIYQQQFLSGPLEDIRILLLDGELVASMKRSPAPGDFRANAAQHGTALPYEPTQDEVNLARRAAEVTGCVFSGVDLMYNAAGDAIVIEVNAVPGWRALQKTCDVDVPDRLVMWLEQRKP